MKLSIEKDVRKHTPSISVGGSLCSAWQFGKSLKTYISRLDRQFILRNLSLRKKGGQVYKDIYLNVYYSIVYNGESL